MKTTNNRLTALASLVKDGRGLADIGTDHGLLPVMLAKAGYTGALFASDINVGPLAAARRTAEEAGLSGRIRFLLCDGLALCPPDEIDTIVIAGMGGDLIVKILDEAEWCMDPSYHLILQPMTKAEVLRYWLVNNGFSIETESIAEDAGTLYQIIGARFGGDTRLSDTELFLGKRSLSGDAARYDILLEQVRSRFEKAIQGMRGRKEEPRLLFYIQILLELEEMRGQR